MIYVLVVVSYFGGTHNGQSVTFQEFNNYDACILAKNFIEEKKYSRWSHDNYKLACLPKGESK